MIRPKVSVAIPVHNAEDYLGGCVESILRQTFTNIQIVLVNDGSTDNTSEICNKYATVDARVEVYHKANEGVSSARNLCIHKATGEYLIFVDADDEVAPDMIQQLFYQITLHSADLAICGHKTVRNFNPNQVNQAVEHKPPTFSGKIKDFLKLIHLFLDSESIQGPCAKMYKTSIIQNHQIYFPVELSFGEDTLFVYRYLVYCRTIASISDCLYLYMKRNVKSLSSVFREDRVDIYLRLYGELECLMALHGIQNQSLIERRICTAALSFMSEVYSNQRLNKTVRMKIVNRVLFNKRVSEGFFNQRFETIQFYLIDFLLKRRCTIGLDSFFYIKEHCRQGLQWSNFR